MSYFRQHEASGLHRNSRISTAKTTSLPSTTSRLYRRKSKNSWGDVEQRRTGAGNDSHNWTPYTLQDCHVPRDSYVPTHNKFDPPDLRLSPLNETSWLSREPIDLPFEPSVSQERRFSSNNGETNRKGVSIRRSGRRSSSSFTSNKKPRSTSPQPSLKRRQDSCPQLTEHGRFSNISTPLPEQGAAVCDRGAIKRPDENVWGFMKGAITSKPNSISGLSLASAPMREDSASAEVDRDNNAGVDVAMNRSGSAASTRLLRPSWRDIETPGSRLKTPGSSEILSKPYDPQDPDDCWRPRQSPCCCPGPVAGRSSSPPCCPPSMPPSYGPRGSCPLPCSFQTPGGPPGFPSHILPNIPLQPLLELVKLLLILVGLLVLLNALKERANDYFYPKSRFSFSRH